MDGVNVGGATLVIQVLLAINSLLLLVAAFFIRLFVQNVMKLTERVYALERDMALIAQHVKFDFKGPA